MLLQITAGDRFCAGVELQRGLVVRAAPIVRDLVQGADLRRIAAICHERGWQVSMGGNTVFAHLNDAPLEQTLHFNRVARAMRNTPGWDECPADWEHPHRGNPPDVAGEIEAP